MTKGEIKALFSKEEFKKILRMYKVKKVAVFGSLVSRRLTAKSDVDFLVDFDDKADLFDQIGLKQDLEKLFGRKVDVATPNSLSRFIRAKILKEAVYL